MQVMGDIAATQNSRFPCQPSNGIWHQHPQGQPQQQPPPQPPPQPPTQPPPQPPPLMPTQFQRQLQFQKLQREVQQQQQQQQQHIIFPEQQAHLQIQEQHQQHPQSHLIKCSVCDLAASGNNFGVATCESCKTFFRRNAKRDSSQIKCLHQNNCNILREYRRACTACRLRKCFVVGMKKDLILSDEKLKTRARPTFKKPRYRWCRVPVELDVEQLLGGIPPPCSSGTVGDKARWASQSQLPSRGIAGDVADLHMCDRQLLPPLQMFQRQQQLQCPQLPHHPEEFPTPGADGGFDDSSTSDMEEESRACSLNETDSLAHNFDLSLVYQQLQLCVKNYQLPHEGKFNVSSPGPGKLFNTEEGFSTLESFVRKTIRLIPQLPGFEKMEKTLLSRIVKFKVFGGIQLTSVLSYDYSRDAWILLLESATGGGGLEEVALETREAMMLTFTGLMSRRCIDGRPLYSHTDVERIHETLRSYYRDLRDLFGDQRQVAALILLGLYLLEDDVGLELRDEERALVKATQWHYMQYLDGLANMQEAAADAANYKAKRAMLLLLPIRWLDVRYSDGSKAMQITRATGQVAAAAAVTATQHQ